MTAPTLPRPQADLLTSRPAPARATTPAPTDADIYARAHADLRRGFAAGELHTRAQREAALRRLRAAIERHEADLLKALHDDLRKPAFEAYSSEIGLCYQEIDHALDGLSRWMRPRDVGVGLLLWPTNASSHYVPKGVVLIVAPWNYPVNLSLAPLIAALAAGCHVVLKPAEDTPHTSAVLAQVCASAFAKTEVAVVEGPGAEVVPALMAAGRFDHVFYTGSTRVGREIARTCGEALIPCTLELGGKSPAYVCADARLGVAADRIAWGKFLNVGQTCVAPDYLLVDRAVYAPLVRSLSERILAAYGKNPIESPDLGRIINGKHFERLRDLLAGASVLHGGQTDAATRFIAPTLLGDVDLDGSLMAEEIFGPLLPIIPVSGFAEAKQIIARHPNPLAAYCFTEDRALADRFVAEIGFGGGCINDCILHLGIPGLPFGGVQQSGLGRYHGDEGFRTFSNQKSIARTSTWLNARVRYPPYRPQLLSFLQRYFG